MKLTARPSATVFSQTLCHMKPMLLLVSQRRFASNLRQRAEHHMTQVFFAPFFMKCRLQRLSKVSQQIVKGTHKRGSDLRMGVGGGLRRIHTPRVFPSSFSVPLLTLPPPACVAQSHGSQRPGRCSQQAFE